MPLSPEDRVRQLAKQNTTCPNCHQTKKFGFGTICIKFHTFVCNECKTSHQAVSHRCKSITMSSWTHEEVDELERKGNAYCEATWLAKAPPVGQGGRPTTGSSIEVFKRFVMDAYEDKRYFSEQPVASTASGSASSYTPQQRQPAPTYQNTPATSQPTFTSFTAPTLATPQPAADFLDFASFDTIPVVSNVVAAPLPAQTPTDPFAPVVPSVTVKNPAPSSSDMFGDVASILATGNNASSFAFMNSNDTNAQAPEPVNKKPVMNTASANGISNMPLMMNAGNMNPKNLSTFNQNHSTGMYPMAGTMAVPGNNMTNGMMAQQQQMSFASNGMTQMNQFNGMQHMNGMASQNMSAMGGMYNQNAFMMGVPFHATNAPVMSYHGGSSAISNMSDNVQQKQQKQKDAFSDLLPF
ncbi:hypothetical protein FisN_8Lh395 [Fistulifera solaris]|uniref:Arf-GAP domain-containing protein n=1 Tax=Fistulifera solaris TaxID=1519565 RepID=A0A1Z5JMS6_FISSO|nr:hypothetical protein FisN_8Lh395 [Fistulifera solaris]|eukprot:GAX15320.1 hypothetical protein FisN_8Lh395 [Fistulifera solaris]